MRKGNESIKIIWTIILLSIIVLILIFSTKKVIERTTNSAINETHKLDKETTSLNSNNAYSSLNPVASNSKSDEIAKWIASNSNKVNTPSNQCGCSGYIDCCNILEDYLSYFNEKENK